MSEDGSEEHLALEEYAELERLRQALLNAQRKTIEAKERRRMFRDALFEAARDSALLHAQPIPPPPPDKRSKGHEEVALLHLTDWQTGKKTASYSTEIATRRLTRVLSGKLDKLIAIERADHPVRRLVIMYGGDLVENVATFPQQAWEVDSTLFDQTFATVRIIEAQLAWGLANFHTVDVFDEEGNHGRLGRKGDYPSGDNMDRIIYRIVRERLEHEKRLTWHPRPDGLFGNLVKAGKYRALLVHGDEMYSHFGSAKPATRIQERFNAWLTHPDLDFVDGYVGHFHQHLVVPLSNGTGRAFLTPSPESDNTYAKERLGAVGVPAQRLHMIDPQRGRVTSERLIWLDD